MHAHTQEIEAWLHALFVLIPLLDREVLKSEVASLALSKGDVEESVVSRCICARILGAVSAQLVGSGGGCFPGLGPVQGLARIQGLGLANGLEVHMNGRGSQSGCWLRSRFVLLKNRLAPLP